MKHADNQADQADGLAAADRAGHDLELAQEKAVERLKEAKHEAAGIVDSANKRAGQIVEEAKDAAVVESDRVKVSAQAEIEQEMNRAREELRGQVAALALSGAEKVLDLMQRMVTIPLPQRDPERPPLPSLRRPVGS